MGKTNALLSVIKEILVEYCPRSSFWRSLLGVYPRMEYDLKSLDVSFADKYILTMNLYDKGTLERIEEIADTLDKNVGMATYETDDFYIKFWKNNDRQIINDDDKNIARIMMSYEIVLYWRRDLYE